MKSSRRGISLIEVLIIISAGSTVVTLSALLIHRTMQTHARAEAFHADEAAAWRLSAQLRLDTAAASEALYRDATLTLGCLDGSEIRYEFATPVVTRRRSRPDGTIVPTAFTLRSVGSWQVTEAVAPRRITLLSQATDTIGHGPTGAPMRLNLIVRLPETNAGGTP